MLARFYLTGPFSGSTLSDNFTIVGNPGGYTTTGVTKAEMQYPSYKEIVFVDSVTGGTVTAVGGTCDGTSVNWSVIPATPTPTPTPTNPILYYSFKQYPGANLTVIGNDYTELLNRNSSAASVVSGQVTIPIGNCPYTVRVSWVSGSGNVVSYRLCDDGGEITYITDIDAQQGFDEYTLSPTPYTAYINIAAQSQTPNLCPTGGI